jgi:hypothetical protein
VHVVVRHSSPLIIFPFSPFRSLGVRPPQ